MTTGKGLQDALPVENQAALAKHIVEVSKVRKNAEASSAFIREPPMALLWRAKDTAQTSTKFP